MLRKLLLLAERLPSFTGTAARNERGYYYFNRLNGIPFIGDSRDLAVSFSHYELAREAAKKFGLDAQRARLTITRKRLNQRRSAMRHFALERARRDDLANADKTFGILAKHGEAIDRCHHAPFQ